MIGTTDVTAPVEDELETAEDARLDDELEACEDALELLNDDRGGELDEDELPQATSAASDTVRTSVFIQVKILTW